MHTPRHCRGTGWPSNWRVASNRLEAPRGANVPEAQLHHVRDKLALMTARRIVLAVVKTHDYGPASLGDGPWPGMPDGLWNMTPTTPTTLVLAGTGKTGRRVVSGLVARDVPVRIGSRRAEPPFDWQDDTTWEPALRGADAAYVAFYPDAAFPGAAGIVGSFADLAVACGIRCLVLLADRGAAEAERCEQAVRESGAEWTIVRAGFITQNFSEAFLVERIRAGVVALPVSDVAEPFTDAEDIADVAVAALTENGHAGQIHESDRTTTAHLRRCRRRDSEGDPQGGSLSAGHARAVRLIADGTRCVDRVRDATGRPDGRGLRRPQGRRDRHRRAHSRPTSP